MQSNRIKIFISAYACEPDLGSEIGVGWHWVLEMNRYFELWVLTRLSNKSHIEGWLEKHPQEHEIHFLYWDLPNWARKWKKGLRGVRTYYIIWQHCTNKIVKRTMQEHNIDIYHLLTYGNSLWPASKYGQKKFFIWGPTGGVDTIPKEYTRYYSKKWRIIESLRRLIVKTLPFNLGFQKRCRDAMLILCKAYSMQNAVPLRLRNKALLFTDVAVETINDSIYKRKRSNEDGIIKYLMVGRLDAWRGFDLAIEAFASAAKNNPNIYLDILGKGSDKDHIVEWIKRFGVQDRVKMHGQVPMNDYYQMMADCDVVLNPCLKEGAVTTAFDSLSFGKPLIGIDTGGYTRYFTNEYAVLIKRQERDAVIQDITNAIIKLTDSKYREKLGNRAKIEGQKFSWEQKGREIQQVIEKSYLAYLNS